MASPNPEADENKNDATTKEPPAEKDVTEAARITVVVSHGKSVNAEVRPHNDETPAKDKGHWNWHTIWQGLTALFTFGAFLAAAYYAHYAKQQAQSTDITAQQAIETNQLAHDNARVQLRAYVDPGSSEGSPIELIQDNKGKVVDIRLHFRNAGSTPARHFAVRSWADVPGGEPPFRTRYLQEVTTGFMKGFPSYTFSALAPSDAGIPAGGKQSVSLPTDAKVIDAFLANYRQGKEPKGEFQIVAGFFEYCDVFGTYRCDSFSYQLVPDPPHFIDTVFGKMNCKNIVRPETVPPFGVTASPTRKWTPLPRCESQEELAVDQGGQQTKK